MKPENLHRHDADRETLSALFDSELQGDAARFAMRRLGHDSAWRETCGRWQLLGDAMRGQGSAQAPADFAARVEAALAAERAGDADRASGTHGPAPTHGSVPATRRWSRGRMGGAALAASVAFVAFLVARPGFDDNAPTLPAEALTVAPATIEGDAPAAPTPEAPTATRMASVPQVAPSAATDAGDPAPAQPGSELGLAAAAVAVAELPRRTREQNSTRGQLQRAGLRASRREAQAPAQVASAAGAATAIGGTGGDRIVALAPTAEPGDLHPFLPPADEIPSRPWPGASLTGAPAAAVTASYSPGGRPAQQRGGSFYPFEPRLSEAQAEALLEALRIEAQPPTREGPRR